MALYVIGDTHLGTGINKNMDLFGPRWINHTQRLIKAWQELVKEEDTVLVAGDISWAINLKEVVPDLAILNQLPGQKILLRGNHDYWWQSLAKIEELFEREGFRNFKLLQNNAHYIPEENVIIAGSRGWLMPSDKNADAHDQKIFKRELVRLDNSLRAAKKIEKELAKGAKEPSKQGARIIAMLHYPPFTPQLERSEVCEILENYGVERVYYGHIHHLKTPYAIWEEKIGKIYYSLIAGDHLNFVPYLIPGRNEEKVRMKKSEKKAVASMTGYGRAQVQAELGVLTCELRSVNHRYHELSCRMPLEFNSLEPEIRKLMKEHFARGKIELRINFSPSPDEEVEIAVDQAKLKAYLRAYKEIAKLVGQNELPAVEAIWKQPEVLNYGASQDLDKLEKKSEQLKAVLFPCLEEAISKFKESREREGAALKKDILRRLEELLKLEKKIAELAPGLHEQFKERLLTRIAELLKTEGNEYYPQQRVATEIAIYADKVAIDEELVRLKAHFSGMQKMLEEGGVLGKKLDFMVQEMNREINTIASKANCLEITEATMAMKNEVEKIREQLQNME